MLRGDAAMGCCEGMLRCDAAMRCYDGMLRGDATMGGECSTNGKGPTRMSVASTPDPLRSRMNSSDVMRTVVTFAPQPTSRTATLR